MCAVASPARAHPAAGAPQAQLITSEQAVQMALERNQNLRAARLNIQEARANEITAGLKPNPVFTSLNQNFPVFTPSQMSWTNVVNSQTFTQSLNYLFERGGKREKRVVVARDTTEMTARTVDDAERQACVSRCCRLSLPCCWPGRTSSSPPTT